ncbi:MAG: hypothetical protein JWM53_1797 [bacterium]|nr:hypothetical protein [bacterium]
MSDITFFAKAFWTVAVVVAAIAALRYVLVPTLIEEFRQRVFQLRRRLFLVMADGLIHRNDVAYSRLYRAMNGTLRYAESVTFFRLLVHDIFMRRELKAADDPMDQAIAGMQNEVARQRLVMLRRQLGFEVARHILISSPLAWGFLLVALPVLKVYQLLRRDAWDAFAQRVGDTRPVKKIEAEMEEICPADYDAIVEAA